jgi:putative peptide zinc metalloprotease protein
VGAVGYRWLVMFSIIMFLNSVLEPYGLKVVGQLLAILGLYGLVVQPTWQLAKFLHVPGRMNQVKSKNVMVTLSVIGAVVLLIALVPLPHYVVCTLEVRPRDAVSVYVDVPGRIDEVRVKPGDQVEQNQPLAQLSNIDRQFQLVELESQRDEYQAQYEHLRRVSHDDRRVVYELGEIEETVNMLQEQIDEKAEQLEGLELKAPVKGTVIPPHSKRGQQPGPGRLMVWSGLATEKKNVGAMLEEQELFCLIGDPERLEAVLVVDQGDVEFVRTEQPVRVQLESHPGTTFHSHVLDISGMDMKESPASLSIQEGGNLATRTDQQTGTQVPISTSYQARVPLEDVDAPITIGTRGQAKIFTGWQTLGSRIWRTVTRTFHFSM